MTNTRLARAEIAFVHPDCIREAWPDVRTGLERLCKRFPQDWIPEDVYSACKAGTATLHTIKEAGERTGFFVLEQTQEYGTKSLHVWVVVHRGGEVTADVIEQLKHYARVGGLKRIRFSTVRNGWARKLERFGFRETLKFLELGLWAAADQATPHG